MFKATEMKMCVSRLMMPQSLALPDCQNCRIGRPYRDAQERLLWRDKTYPART